MTTTIKGTAAIKYAEDHGVSVSKYADPTEGARDGLTVAEAREIAREDVSLIYVEIERGTVVAELPARSYEDHDDCLTAAVGDVAEDLGLETWQLAASWDDETSRDAIIVRA